MLSDYKVNFVCNVFQPFKDNPDNKFVFHIHYRDSVVISDGIMYDDIVSCTNALCNTINKLADHDINHRFDPLNLTNNV